MVVNEYIECDWAVIFLRWLADDLTSSIVVDNQLIFLDSSKTIKNFGSFKSRILCRQSYQFILMKYKDKDKDVFV